ncbi:MAG: hypothetical protein AVO35_01415 [Candidatus Aegiribacteria sp. MLS_C]|nr:MAG: hypothetical protein AVO35_01415 [Candidatus Aegiribacteria sp. MLS_C]
MEKGELMSTSLNIFHIGFRLENLVTHSADGSDDERKTYVLDIEAWGNLAEDVDRNVRNGMLVLVEGSLVSRSYIDRMKRMQYRMVVKAAEIIALGT